MDSEQISENGQIEEMAWSPALTREPRGMTSSCGCCSDSPVQPVHILPGRVSMSAVPSFAYLGLNSSDDVIREGSPFTDVSVNNPCLLVWRAYGLRIRSIEKKDYGFFDESGCYMVLKVNEDRTCSINVWQGRKATRTDTIEKMSRELDEHIHKAAIFTREMQGHETDFFLRNFPEGVVYVDIKGKGKMNKTAKKLYIIKGRKYAVASMGEINPDELDPSSVILLDGYPRMYLWMGQRTDTVTRVKAIQLTKRLRACQRNGRAHIVVIDDNDTENNATFLKKLQNTKKFHSSLSDRGLQDGSSTTSSNVINLHRVTGQRVLYDMPFATSVPLHQRFLVSTESFLLDRGPCLPLFIWVGAKAQEQDYFDAITRARKFAEHLSYPAWLPLCRVMEAREPVCFKYFFRTWKELLMTKPFASHRYSIASIEHGQFSQWEPGAVPSSATHKASEDDLELTTDGSTEMFRVDHATLATLATQCREPGVFNSSDCYVILHRPSSDPQLNSNFTIFYWLGRRSSAETQSTALALSMNLSSKLDNAVVIRALDGHEPRSLLTIFDRSIVELEIQGDGVDVQMYCVREWAESGMRVHQVPPSASSLNSSAAFVLIAPNRSILWYGKFTGGLVREFAKNMLAFLDSSRMYTYEAITEGGEADDFWGIIGPQQPYPEEFIDVVLPRRTARLSCCNRRLNGTLQLEEIDSFTQEVFLWCGNALDDHTKKTLLPNLLQDYLDCDPAQRNSSEVQLWIVMQGKEPKIFYQHFPFWDRDGYTGQDVYQLTRKALRQENARIKIFCQEKRDSSTDDEDMTSDACTPVQSANRVRHNVLRAFGSSRGRATQKLAPGRRSSSLNGCFRSIHTA
ncbi:gelsolin, cytoplasmic-like isoform X2 [Pomacea canaliculata]|uniref:gelsolin, cytoplasmic-like isoform X2 n=1 Tax=Pomacea canaliculata TaxID=400727 RepID=UPI000D736756|nr:gelsolin, cytoplasmic-like isoform X2 [Pomacea canaliculata]